MKYYINADGSVTDENNKILTNTKDLLKEGFGSFGSFVSKNKEMFVP